MELEKCSHEYYEENFQEFEVFLFEFENEVPEPLYMKVARKFCEMFLRLNFAYEYNKGGYQAGLDGHYLGKVHFLAHGRPRGSDFVMEVGGDD